MEPITIAEKRAFIVVRNDDVLSIYGNQYFPKKIIE